MRVFEMFPCGSATVWQRTILAFQIPLVATLFFTLMVALPAFAQQEAPAEEAPPDAVGETDETREGDAESEADSSGAEATATDTEPTDFPVDEPDIIVPVPDEDIEEILIKGSSSATKLDEPISIVQFGVEQMRAEGIRDIRDLSNFTPSLEIKSAFAATNATIFIRGVGLDDFNANAVSAVAIYQDGVYLNSPSGQLFGFFDLENVEVLRGPQGTLYRNASAGAILVNSRRPTDELEAHISSSYGRFNAVDLEAAIGGPIVPDLLSGRVAGSWSFRDPITHNRCAEFTREQLDKLGKPPKPPADVVPPLGSWCGDFGIDPTTKQKRFVVDEGMNNYTNDVDGWGARAQLLLTVPPELAEMEWLLNAHGGQNRSRAAQWQHIGVKFDRPGRLEEEISIPEVIGTTDFAGYKDTDGDIYAGDYDIDGPEDLNLFGTNLRGTWRFGETYELESITGYEWNERFTVSNDDASPLFQLNSHLGNTSWQASQEFNLRGEWIQSDYGDGSWVLGTLYMHEDLEVQNFYDQSGGVDLLQTYDQKLRSFAAYAYSDYKIQPGCSPVPCDFTLITGLRYNYVYKEFDIEACYGTNVFSGQCVSELNGDNNSTWDGLGGEVSLAWHFYEDNSLYLKWARGWKGGHFNGGASGRNDLITGVEPEIVDNFEGGIRSYWFDGRLMFNVTGFWYDYQDLQVFQLVQTPLGFPISRLVNANDALVYGVEVDLAAEPLPGLNITFNGSWVESEYLDFKVPIQFRRRERPCPNCEPIQVTFEKQFDYSGSELVASPNFSMTGSISYEIPLPGHIGSRGLGFLVPRFSFSWKDDINFDASDGKGPYNNFPEGTFSQSAFWIFNGSLGWRSENSGLEVIGWVHNFMDKHYKTQRFDTTRGFGTIIDAWSDPRTYGLTVTATY